MKINFGMIALNAECFIRQSIESVYKIANKIIVVEGAVTDSSTGKCMVANEEGLSTDKTKEIVLSIKDPDHKIIYHAAGYVKSKEILSNIYLDYCKENPCDYIWQLDSDELYEDWALEDIVSYLENHKDVIRVDFRAWNFIKNMETVGALGYWVLPYRRLFKYTQGCSWSNHTPPELVYKDSVSGVVLSDKFTNARGWNVFHYSWVTEKQVVEKIKYYRHREYYRPGWVNRVWRNLDNPAYVKMYGAHPFDENYAYTGSDKTRTEPFLRKQPKAIENHPLYKKHKDPIHSVHLIQTWCPGGGCKCPYLISRKMFEKYGDTSEYIYSMIGAQIEYMSQSLAFENRDADAIVDYINKKGFDILHMEWWTYDLEKYRHIAERVKIPKIATVHVFPCNARWLPKEEDMYVYGGVMVDTMNMLHAAPFNTLKIPVKVLNAPGDTDAMIGIEKIDHSGFNVTISVSYDRDKFRTSTFDMIKTLLSKYHDLCVYFIGISKIGSDYENAVMKEFRGMERVYYRGFVETPDFFRYMDAVFNILPDSSYAASESFLQEAMAAKIPSIKLGGHGSTVLTPGNKGGFIAKDEEEFYKFFDILHSDKQLREQMGNDGLEIIKQKYLIEYSAEVTRNFYKELINAH